MKHLTVNVTDGFVYMLIQFVNAGVHLKNTSGADKSLARLGRKQAYVSVRMA